MEGRFSQILDRHQGLKIRVPSGCPGETLIFRITRRALGGVHVPLTKVFRRLTTSVNETIVKPHIAAAVGCKPILKSCLTAATNTCTSNFSDVKFRVAWLI